jgi:hypothetical protein
MAKREISIVLKAKNELAVGLAQAKSAISDFGESALRIGKLFAGAFLAAGTAIAGFATKALSAYSVQETSVKSLEGALRAYGEEVEVNSKRIQDMASAIQDETGVADENLIARAARLRLLGVEVGQMDEALRATVALAAVGMEEEAAIKAVAMAREGNYNALSRYIPALRTAATEEEKALILQDFLTKGYEQQKATLDTLGGQWNALKGRVGDAWEEFGRAIAQNDTIKAALESAGEAVKNFGARVREWVDSGGVENATAQVKFFGEYASYYFMLASNTAHLAFSTLGDTLAMPFRYAVGVIKGFVEVNIQAFTYMADYAVAVFEKIKRPFSAFEPPDTSKVIGAFGYMVDALAASEIRKNNLTRDALLVREQLHIDHARRVSEIGDSQLEALARQNARAIEQDRIARQASVEASQQAGEQIKAIAEDVTDKITQEAQNRLAVEVQNQGSVTSANIMAADTVKQTWEDAYNRVADASIYAADVAVQSAERVQSAMANTGFNQGLTGRTFGAPSSSKFYDQAIANLERQGYKIGGTGNGLDRVAGPQMIATEVRRLEALAEANKKAAEEAERERQRAARAAEQDAIRAAQQQQRDQEAAARLRLPFDVSSYLNRLGAFTDFTQAANNPALQALASSLGGLSNVGIGGLARISQMTGIAPGRLTIDDVVRVLQQIKNQQTQLLTFS